MVHIKVDDKWYPLSDVIADRLKSYHSQGMAAEEMGIDASTLSRVKKGGEPDLFTFGLLWDWLGVEIEGVRVE